MKKGSIAKLALVTAFAAALAGCGQSTAPSSPSESTSTRDTVEVSPSMKVVNEYDNYLDRYADFRTNQLCIGKTGNSSDLSCRDFDTLSPEARDYVTQLGTLLQNPRNASTSSRDEVVVNTASRVFNEYGQYFERYVDFKTGTLCLSKTGNSSSLTCTDFPNLSKAQKDYVDYARQEMNKALNPAPGS